MSETKYGYPLIFLDVDGVLNSHDFNQLAQSNTIHRNKIDLLNAIIHATDALIVLSSAWRYHIFRGEMNLDGINWLFRSHGLMAGRPDGKGKPTNRIVGVTRPDTMIDNPKYPGNGHSEKIPMPDERGQQIADWRTLNRHTGRYVVIDDLDLGINEAEHPFIWTCKDRGLFPFEAKQAIDHLKGIS